MGQYTRDGLPGLPLVTNEAIKSILSLAPSNHRAALLSAVDGSRRAWLFSDAKAEYEALPYVPTETIRVSSLRSFIALVNDRMLEKAGEHPKPTVIFSRAGAIFLAHKASLDTYTYQRCLSPAWLALKANLGKCMDHAGFLRFLHSISGAVERYSEIVRQFKRVVFNQNATISSAPILDEDGDARMQYTLEMSARDGKSAARLPGQLSLLLPYAQGGIPYPVELELDIALAQTGGAKTSLSFTLFAPEWADVEISALEGEVRIFREDSVTQDILILEDF
jgi:hypothetical protein